MPRALSLRAACLALTAAAANSEGFDPKRTRFIDNVGNNWLFRGNEPVINGTFAAAELEASMRQAAVQAGKVLPANFTITDISFDNPTELPDENAEKRWFKENPSGGRYINWIIIGNLGPPDTKDQHSLKKLLELKAWNHDSLPTRMDTLRGYMTSPPAALPQVIYMHCEAGTDRTGEVSGAYYIKWQNMTFPQAVNIDNHIQNRDMSKYSLYGLEWYCWYLELIEGVPNLACGGKS